MTSQALRERILQLQHTLGVPATGEMDGATLTALEACLLIEPPPMASLDERKKGLQRAVEVSPDGDIGNVSLDALELAVWASAQPAVVGAQPRLAISRKGIARLVQFEVTSPRHYNKALAHPTWPGGESGVTIGIGYDLGYRTQQQLREDWHGRLSGADIESLATTCGAKGSAARAQLPKVAHVRVPLQQAGDVLLCRTLPEFAGLACRTYPGIEKLPADAQAALLSLVYNRGGSLSGERRKEMAAIRPLVASGDLAGIAAQLRSMKRLWAGTEVSGLVERREREALLVAGAGRPIDEREIVRV